MDFLYISFKLEEEKVKAKLEKTDKTRQIVIMQEQLFFKQQRKERIMLIDTTSMPQHLVKYYELP